MINVWTNREASHPQCWIVPINIETKIQDRKLNKAYKNVMKALEPNKQQELKEVQRLWVKYRDAYCGFYYGLTGGTIDSLNASSCFLNMTTERVEELENIVE